MRAVGRKQRGEIGAKSESKMRAVFVDRFKVKEKEIEENNRMGKTRDLFKKIRDTKGTFHAKMGSIKDRNGMALRSRSH